MRDVRPQIFLTRHVPDPVLVRLQASFDVSDEVGGSAGLVTIPADVVDAELFDAAGPGLRIVANFGVGYDSVDVKEATRRGIVVANTPVASVRTSGERTLVTYSVRAVVTES